MLHLAVSAAMRGADDKAIHMTGIPSTLLMTNAAGHLARAAEDVMGANRRAVIFCGSGNNGGDGIAAAFYLLRRGAQVRVFLVGEREKMTADTREMERRLIELGGTLEEPELSDAGLPKLLDEAGVIIDAMFGVGLRGALRGRAREAALLMNASATPVVAADIPSGVIADTGEVPGEAVRCVKTVTFSMAKIGHFSQPGNTYAGEVEICDIGIPDNWLREIDTGVYALEAADALLPRRQSVSHKGDYGKLLICGGSVGLTGAPTLCARASVRAGAGLTFLGVPKEIYGITAQKNDEAMPFPLADDGSGRISERAWGVLLEKMEICDVAVLGPGLGRSGELTALVGRMVRESRRPLVLDADALFALGQDMEALQEANCPVILTPHDGEFARMGGVLTGDRVGDARAFAKKYDCVLVLKGHRTVIAFPDGEVYITTTGNPGMAKGGSGDVLAGVLGAMLCQFPLKKAVTAAVWLHGRAGDLAAEAFGEYSMTASDIIDMLPKAIKTE